MVKLLYRRFAGPEATLSELPLMLLRRLIGDTLTIRANGRPLTIDLRNTVTSYDLLTGRYEPDETRLVKQTIGEGAHVVDVGANIGYFSILLGILAGQNGSILAIEPDPQNASLLRRNIADNGLAETVTVVEGAVGAQPAQLPLYLNAVGNLGDHRLYESVDVSRRGKVQREKVTVSVHRLDDLVGDWTRLDFIKMDIQGYESRALEGMAQTLRRFDRACLLTEFWPKGITDAGDDPRGFLRSLGSFGFELFEVSKKLVPVNEDELLNRLNRSELHANLFCTRAALKGP